MRNSILAILVVITCWSATACKKKADPAPAPNSNSIATVLTGTAATEVTDSSFVLNSSILTLGKPTITVAGLLYGTLSDPKLGDPGVKTMANTSLAVGSFTSRIAGLNASTTYFARAYATNTEGTGYGTSTTITTKAKAVQVVPTFSEIFAAKEGDGSLQFVDFKVSAIGFTGTFSDTGAIGGPTADVTLANAVVRSNRKEFASLFVRPGGPKCFAYLPAHTVQSFYRAFVVTSRGTFYSSAVRPL